jgi:hypothetical protein
MNPDKIKEDIKPIIEKEEESLIDYYNRTRSSAIALSVTMLAFSSAGIFSLKELKIPLISHSYITVLFALIIVLSLLIQYFHFLGEYFTTKKQFSHTFLGKLMQWEKNENLKKRYYLLKTFFFNSFNWLSIITPLLLILTIIYYVSQLLMQSK